MKERRKLKRNKSWMKRLFSTVLAIALVLNMCAVMPASVVSAQETAGTNVTLHFYNGNWNWGAPAIQYWGGASTTVSGAQAGPTEIPNWGGVSGYTMTAAEDGWYTITLRGDFEGFQFLDMNNSSNNTGGTVYHSYIKQYNGDNATDIYYKESDKTWYLDAGYETALPNPDGDDDADLKPDTTYNVVIHYYDVQDWGAVTAHMGEGESWTPIAGYEDYKVWPGVSIPQNAEHSGWFDLSVTKTNDQILYFIFSNAGANQTPNTSIAIDAETVEAWYYNGQLLKEAPEVWNNPPQETATSMYYAKDVMTVKIGETVYPMNVYAEGLFEAVVTLPAGTHTATLIQNGVTTAKTAQIDLSAEGKVYVRLQEDNLTAGAVETLALVGSLGNLSANLPDWNPASPLTELTYLGGGLYVGTITFESHEADVAFEYKVAFNDSWDKSLGAGGGNIKQTMPAANTSFTVYVDSLNGKVYDDVSVADISINGIQKNGFTTTVSLIGEAREDSNNTWTTGTKGYEFTQISKNLYRYEKTFANAGTYPYKAVFDYSEWYGKEGTGNRYLTLTEENTHVVFLYDAQSEYLFDTINNEAKVASLLGMKVKPAEMEIVENADGTTMFVAVASEGDEVYLNYADKTEAENKGADAFTRVKLGEVKNGRSSSEALWLGDAALDVIYYYEIAGERVLDGGRNSVMVAGAEYSNYTRAAFAGRTVNLPGTLPGKSWDAASNPFRYDGNRIYSITFANLPAGNYEYKVAIGGSWAENYGLNGALDGGNIKLSVPAAQDVTIYYSDVTHLTVNSVDYKFVEPVLTGTGVPDGTKLTDAGLTGIYNAGVNLAAGNYADLAIVCDAKTYTFNNLVLTEAKTVNFYMDPVLGLFYHDGSDEKVNTDAIYFDSKDAQYKSAFGAVATGEEITFRLMTGTDATSASLLFNGPERKTVSMSKDGEAEEGQQKWIAKTTLNIIGEYDYYFAVSNGADVCVYGDDDGYYGTGKASGLTDVQAYDLIVYQAGFTTPDWMKNGVIYQIFPDRFYDGDASNNQAQTTARGDVDYEFITDWSTIPENPEQEALLDEETYKSTGAHWGDGQWSNEIYGGDLKGITQRIEYLKALGVTVIYLNPVFSSISSHRYDACDYTKIDPILGTEGDFTELVRVAEENGMTVVLDGVFNHVSDDSVYFDRYYKFLDDGLATIGAYPYWAYVYDYMAENKVEQGGAETAAKQYFTATYGITDYSYTEWFEVYTTAMTDGNGNPVYDKIGQRTDKPVYGYQGWWGYDSMPVIKSTNGSEYQTGDWAEDIIYNAEGTSVTQYWISKGMDGWRLDVANEVSDETWQAFRQSVKSLDSEAVIIGEIWDDATKYILGDMYDSVMNYLFRNAVTSFAMGSKAEDITKDMERIRERYPEEAFYAMMNLVGSHDTSRILSYLDGIGDDRADKSMEAAFPTYEKTSDLAKQRQYLVAFLQFTYAGAPTIYYGDEIGVVGGDDPDDRRTFAWGEGCEKLVKHYATLGQLRKVYPELRTGSVEVLSTGNEHVLGYVRADANEKIVVLANNSQQEQSIVVDIAKFRMDTSVLYDALGGGEFAVTDGKVTVKVPAILGVILVKEAKTIVIDEDALAPTYDKTAAERPSVTPTPTPNPTPAPTPNPTPTPAPEEKPAEEGKPEAEEKADEAGKEKTEETTESSSEEASEEGTAAEEETSEEESSTESSETAESEDVKAEEKPEEEPVKEEKPVEKTEKPVEQVTVETEDAWEEICKKFEEVKEEANLSIQMNGQSRVPGVFLSQMVGQSADVVVVLEMDDGIKWTISAATVTGEKADVDFKVSVDSENIPDKTVKKLVEMLTEQLAGSEGAEEAIVTEVIQISLAHEGDFGCQPVLTLPVGSDKAGKYANLYYYNEKTKTMEFITSGLIDEDGNVDLRFTHASEYAVVIGANAASQQNAVSDNASGGSQVVICVALVVCIVIGLAAIGYAFRRKKQ